MNAGNAAASVRTPDPCSFVIFGASGDLTHRLLMPALYNLAAGGLLPAAFSTGIGSQVQKPLAVVVVGGSFLAPLLILLVMPVLIDLFSRRRAPVGAPRPLPATAE